MHFGLECSNYNVLSEADRGQGSTGVVKCDKDDDVLTDDPSWYRFQGEAGTQMPDQCVEERHCGTDAAGWLDGGHPTVDQGIVSRRVCFHWSSNCCSWSQNIRVRNCGDFYVYELSKPSHCSLRFCGNGEQGKFIH